MKDWVKIGLVGAVVVVAWPILRSLASALGVVGKVADLAEDAVGAVGEGLGAVGSTVTGVISAIPGVGGGSAPLPLRLSSPRAALTFPEPELFVQYLREDRTSAWVWNTMRDKWGDQTAWAFYEAMSRAADVPNPFPRPPGADLDEYGNVTRDHRS